VPTEPPYSEKELLRQIARGDEASFSYVFELYQDKVFKSAWLYLKSEDLAKEVVQDVFIKLWSKRTELEGVQSFSSWFMTLAKNHIIDYVRKLATQEAVDKKWASDHPDHEDSTDFKVRTSQYERLIEEALGELSPQQQAVFKLARAKGLTYEQIGVELSLAPNTVKTHMARALHSIKNFLRKHGEVYLLLLLMGK
jgi:RNA polymerase sigma-70 factor (family 1)